MSFNFQWPKFSKDFHTDAAKMLDSALNRGPKPKVIADDIKVKDINMGNIPPELEILEIGELSTDRFRGIFRLTYAGDAHLTLSTKVQANPLTRPAPSSSDFAFEDASSVFPSSMPSRGILFAARPLAVPMQLRLSAVRLKAIVVLVVSKQKGITLVFKNDPLESVDVSSTFDSVEVIQKYLQQEIEGQLREMFREDLPGIIHRLSQRWLSGSREGQKGTAATGPTTSTHQPPFSSPKTSNGLTSNKSSPEKKGYHHKAHKAGAGNGDVTSSSPRSPLMRKKKSEKAGGLATSPPSSPRTTHRGSTLISSSPRASAGAKGKGNSAISIPSGANGEREMHNAAVFSSSLDQSHSWNEMERYDPTYGLRPDEVRMSMHGSGFSGLARLAGQVNGGLKDLALPDTAEDGGDSTADDEPIQSTLPPEATMSEDEQEEGEEEDREEASGEILESETMLDNLDLSDDDVPDHPHGDEQVEDYDERADSGPSRFSAYRSPPPTPAFDDGARRSSSGLNLQSSSGGSPRTARSSTRSQSFAGGASKLKSAQTARRRDKVEYETIPAVGGGLITRPRIYHTASRVQAPEVEEEDEVGEYRMGEGGAASSTARGPSSSQTYTIRPSKSYQDDLSGGRSSEYGDQGEGTEGEAGTDDSPSALGHDSLATLEPEPMDPSSTAYRTQMYRQQYGRLYRAGYSRQSSMSSTLSSSEASRSIGGQMGNQSSSAGPLAKSTSRSSTAPTSTYPSTRPDHRPRGEGSFKAQVVSPYTHHPSPPRAQALAGHAMPSNQSMTMGASHHFIDLVNSNHTLSPFTRTLDTKGYAVRSHPVTPSTGTGSGGETSSSVGGAAVRPALTSTRSALQPRESVGSGGAGYFDRHKATSEGGRRRRTFKIGGKGAGGNGEQGVRRPDSTPIQQQRAGSEGTRRAHSSAMLNASASSNGNGGRLANVVRGGSRSFAQSERASRMGAIRE